MVFDSDNMKTWHFMVNFCTNRTTSYYKYMDLLFTPKLSLSSAKIKIAAQAKKAIFAIRKYQISFGMFVHQEIFKLFDSMVIPIMCSGSEIW